MSAIDSQDPTTPEPANPPTQQFNEDGRGGSGAASALERMKADHALRHRHKHGTRAAGPGHEDDRSAER